MNFRMDWLFVFGMLGVFFWEASLTGRIFIFVITAALSFALTAVDMGRDKK